jgi:hypothetical protein
MNPETLVFVNRTNRGNPKVISEKIGLIRRVDPESIIEFELIYGLPGDNYQTFRNSIDILLSASADSLKLYPLLLLPGSEFSRKIDEYKFRFDNTPPYEVRSNKWFSENDMEKARTISYLVLMTTYFPVILKMIYRISDKRGIGRGRLSLIEELIHTVMMETGPLVNKAAVSYTNSTTAFNMNRRRVINKIAKPKNCLRMYTKLYDMMFRYNIQDDGNIALGIDYYHAKVRNKVYEIKALTDKFGQKSIDDIKCKWTISEII